MTRIIILAVLILLIFGGAVFVLNKNKVSQNIDTTTANPNSETISENSSGSTCTDLTAKTTEGPYFVTGTDKLPNNNLNFTNLPGTPIKVAGYVYDGTSSIPISNAKIELWQADDSGDYHPNSNGPASNYEKDELDLRGYINSDEEGRFEFTSIYPGDYEGRARHIHVRLTADGFDETITQIIFLPKASDSITNENDTIAQSLPSCHLLQMREVNGIEYGEIDFRLQEI